MIIIKSENIKNDQEKMIAEKQKFLKNEESENEEISKKSNFGTNHKKNSKQFYSLDNYSKITIRFL